MLILLRPVFKQNTVSFHASTEALLVLYILVDISRSCYITYQLSLHLTNVAYLCPHYSNHFKIF